MIPKEYQQAYLRYEVWVNNLQRLNEVLSIKKRAFDKEKKITKDNDN